MLHTILLPVDFVKKKKKKKKKKKNEKLKNFSLKQLGSRSGPAFSDLVPDCKIYQQMKKVTTSWVSVIIIPHVNSPYKTSIDERLIFYNIPRCYSDGEYCHLFAIAAGDII